MDKLAQIGRNLNQTNKNATTALQRTFPDRPLTHKIRDVFDLNHPFEMEFNVPEQGKVSALNLIFSPPPPCSNQSQGCFIGRCDFYSGITSTVLVTTYAYISGTTFVYINDVVVTYTESGASQITLSASPSSTDLIRVCYVYQITGCTE